jgi:hypothetical protein
VEKFVKRNGVNIIFMTFVVAAMLSIAFLSLSNKMLPFRFYTIVKMPSLIEPFVIGEIVHGKVFEQKLYLSELNPARVSFIPRESPFCVGALMATYCDRRNKGDVRLSIKFPDGRMFVNDIPFKILRDNKYHKVCFDDLSIDDLLPGEYLVRLEGLGGKSGSSATVWLTKHDKPPFDFKAHVDGELVEGTLVVGFLIRQRVPMLEYPMAVLIILYASLTMLLIFAIFYDNKNNSP